MFALWLIKSELLQKSKFVKHAKHAVGQHMWFLVVHRYCSFASIATKSLLTMSVLDSWPLQLEFGLFSANLKYKRGDSL